MDPTAAAPSWNIPCACGKHSFPIVYWEAMKRYGFQRDPFVPYTHFPKDLGGCK